jgi:beta-glucanase (GH16 family)
MRFWNLIVIVVASTTTPCTMAEEPKPLGDILQASPGEWEFLPSQSDEFDAKEVDTKKWNLNTEDWGVWSWEPENTTQKDGSLHLQIVQQTHQRGKNTFDYTSGIARNNETITYGYFEARVKGCSRYPGACPSFWLYSKGPENRYLAKDGETVTYSEIDIVELQQSEWDFKEQKHFEVNHIDCNLHSRILKDGKNQWVRQNTHPELCKNEYDAPWDPREDYHVYAVHNTADWIVWYIDGKEVARKPNLYWHLPMHVTFSLGLRYPFVTYQDGERLPVPEKTTTEGFPTTMSVDYVRVWRDTSAKPPATKSEATDRTKAEYIAEEKVKWAKNGWTWNQAKVESNFEEMDADKDGIASGLERKLWYDKKK